MKISTARMKSLEREQEKRIGEVRSTLDSALGKFQSALEFRISGRERLAATMEKISARKKETSAVLKQLRKNMESAVTRLEKITVERDGLKKEEAVLKGRYRELLMGRLADQPEAEEIEKRDKASELKEMQERFMSSIRREFLGLDAQIDGMKERKTALDAQITRERVKKQVRGKKIAVLSRTLEIYENELANVEEELEEFLEEEELLLQEYADFTARLGAVASIPRSVEKLLDKSLVTVGKGDKSSPQSK